MDRHFDVPVYPAYLPDSVRIRSFDVEQYPDGCGLKWTLAIAESNISPDTEIVIEDQEGHAVDSRDIIGKKQQFDIYCANP